MINQGLKNNTPAYLQDLTIWIGCLFLLAACSKPDNIDKNKKTNTNAIPASSQRQLDVTNDLKIKEIPKKLKSQGEDVAIYASALGIDVADAETLLRSEMVFSSELTRAIESSNRKKLLTLTSSHFSRLAEATGALNKFQPEGNGNLPKWWSTATSRDGIEGIAIKMSKPGYLGIGKEYLIDQRAIYGCASSAARVRLDLLNDIITSRANEDPLPMDAIVYQGIIDGLSDNPSYQRADNSEPDVSQPGRDLILDMATTKNPIYRLFAVEQASRFNTKDRLSLFDLFVTEKDPIIKQIAIEGASQVHNVKTLDLLRRFEQNSLQQGDTANANLASQSIKRIHESSSRKGSEK